MKIINYKKGERIDCMTIAGEDFDIATDDNIRIDCFLQKEFVQIPNLESLKQGTGKLDELLKEIELYYQKPLLFMNVVNYRLKIHLRNLGYLIKEDNGNA